MTFITNVITTPAESQLGAFGRLRTAQPYTMVETSHLKDINSEQETQSITGAGTITLNTNAPLVDMTLTGAGTLVKQTRARGIYQASKSLLVYLTGVLNSGINATGVTSRIGYFDADDGAYFEHQGGTGLFITIRSSGSGSVVNNSISQASWNVDKMDGTGPSGKTIDATKNQIFFLDFEWLGAGMVRSGFIIEGKYCYAHKFFHSNLVNQPYMNSPNQPIRYEISSSGGAGSLKKICGAVVSEGGGPAVGRQYTVNMGITYKSVSSNEKSVLALRMKTGFPKANIRINSIVVGTNNNIAILVTSYILRDVVSTTVLPGASWTSASTVVEYDISATSFIKTGSIITQSDIINNKNKRTYINMSNTYNDVLTTNIAGISDLFVVSGISINNSSCPVSVIINYSEIN
jgi:hypothetical protein